MQLKIIGSNSDGNAYLLENATEALLIECGMGWGAIKRAVNFNIAKIKGCLVTHEHKDHCKSAKEILTAGISIYASYGTHGAMKTEAHHRARFLHLGAIVAIGGFKIKSFPVQHDAAEPLGFLIHHTETGTVLFLTDSFYSQYRFDGLNQVIIEANYSNEILNQRRESGETNKVLRDRVLESHMSLDTCIELLQANDLRQVANIVLIHLSDGHSDEREFKRQIQAATGRLVHVATNGMIIANFDKKPF